MNGKAHTTISLALTAPCAILGAVAGGGIGGLGAGLGCLASVLINPDLDQEGISRIEWKLVRKTGPLGFAFLAYWWPYAKAVPHRSPVSHMPMLGTVVRLAYLNIPTYIALLCGADLTALPLWVRQMALWWALGLAISDVAHWLMDGLLLRALGVAR